MIVIVDYGLGNLRSIYKSCKKYTKEVIISSSKDKILKSKKIILPGVGQFKTAMENLKSLDLIPTLNSHVSMNKPILGICLGMQIMTNFSEEGEVKGLGWINANTKKFNVKMRIPQVGWNSVHVLKSNNLLEKKDLRKIRNEFFFVHSYHVELVNLKDGLFETTYSNKKFISGFSSKNIYGVQFHPEKSYDVGEKLISNFILDV